jgi:branched-chain amino acid transport system substrate-binding protein
MAVSVNTGGGIRKRSASLRPGKGMIAIGALTLAAVVGTACGSSSTSNGGGTSAVPKVLLIGENAIKSGPAAVSFAITQGFESYLNYINSQGGVNGYTFKWDVRDNAYDPTQSALAENQLMAENPFAIAVVGTVPVSAAGRVAQSNSSKIPLLVSADGALVESIASQSNAPPIYTIIPDYTHLGPFDAKYVMETLGDKNFGLVYENDSLAQGAQKAIASYVPANGGTLAANLPITTANTNLVPTVTQLQASGAKTVLVWASSNLVASVQKAAAQIGYNPKWVTPFFALNSGYLKLAGSLAEGTYIDGIFPPPTSDNAAVKNFVTATTSYASSAVTGSGQQGWELAATLVAAIKSATANGGTLTSSSFVSALGSLNATVEFAKMNFTGGRHSGVAEASYYQVQGGQFVQVAQPSALP